MAGPDGPDPTRKSIPTWLLVVCGAGCLLMVLVIGGILAAVMIPALLRAREAAKIASCANNLRVLGTSVALYSSQHGDAPYANPATGKGFWETLWSVPDARTCITPLPESKTLFLCPVYGEESTRSIGALDYTHPNLGDRKLYPTGVLAGRTPADRMIAGDFADDQDPNHLRGGFNVLRYDGSVHRIHGGTAQAQEYREATTGKRVP